MQQALRAILINSVGIALTALFLPGISYGNRLTTLIIAAVVLGIANTFIKPVLALILLPINVITLGIAGLLLNSILLFIVTLIVPDFNIIPFILTLGGTRLHIPIIISYIICSTAISLVTGFLRWIVSHSA